MYLHIQYLKTEMGSVAQRREVASSNPIHRLGRVGWAVAGVALAAGWLLDIPGDSLPGRLLVYGANVLLVFGLTSLYGGWIARRARLLGTVGYLAAVTGHVTMSTVTFLTALGSGPRPDAYELLRGMPGTAFAAFSGVLLLVGYLGLGAAVVRSQDLPRVPGVLMILGIVLLFAGTGPIGPRSLAAAGSVLLGSGLFALALAVGSPGVRIHRATPGRNQ